MASNKCASCDEKIGDKMVSCDSCHIVLHPTERCTSLSASELRAVVILKRSLFFFCSECRVAFKSIPKILREIEILKTDDSLLKTEINTLKKENLSTEVASLKSEIHTLKEEKSNIPVTYDIINELHERQKRSTNLLIFNLPESSSTSEDINKVTTLLSGVNDFSTNVSDTKIFRFGKKNKNGHRPIKVVFSSTREVHEILRNKVKLGKANKVFFQPDLTLHQKQQLDSVRNDLLTRQQAGETNLFIKYYNNIPRILSKC